MRLDSWMLDLIILGISWLKTKRRSTRVKHQLRNAMNFWVDLGLMVKLDEEFGFPHGFPNRFSSQWKANGHQIKQGLTNDKNTPHHQLIKANLRNAMESHGIPSWQNNRGAVHILPGLESWVTEYP